MNRRIAVLGAGSWGTALAHHWAADGHPVVLWGRDAERIATIRKNRSNERYLPGVELDPGVELTADLADLSRAHRVVMVVPSHGYRAVLRDFLRTLPEDGSPRTVVSATKGIEIDTLARMSQVTEEEAAAAGRWLDFGVLTGPTFAAELVRGAPTAAVLAATDEALATELQGLLSTSTFRLYSSTDVVGVELGGTSKNVIAIAAGVVSGLELGHNTLAALLTRGLHEITRLGIACGGDPRTFAGLAGMGDLVLTCTGGLSRNRRLGVELAAGKTAEAIAGATPMVAEGWRNSLAVARLAERHGVEMPITEQMVQILYHGKSPKDAVATLMGRDLRMESEL